MAEGAKNNDCLFCKIVAGQMDSQEVYDDKLVKVFRDISPQAPSHILIIPKEHIRSLNETNEEHRELLGHILMIAKKIAKQEKIAESGYRVLVNTEDDSGWGIHHLHFHLLGGKFLGTKLVSDE